MMKQNGPRYQHRAERRSYRATAHELITTIDSRLAELQKERQAQQEQPQAAEQTNPDGVFSKVASTLTQVAYSQKAVLDITCMETNNT